MLSDIRLNLLLGEPNSLHSGYITDGFTCESQGCQVRKSMDKGWLFIWLEMAQDEVQLVSVPSTFQTLLGH